LIDGPFLGRNGNILTREAARPDNITVDPSYRLTQPESAGDQLTGLRPGTAIAANGNHHQVMGFELLAKLDEACLGRKRSPSWEAGAPL
jgi:hypothetical protein